MEPEAILVKQPLEMGGGVASTEKKWSTEQTLTQIFCVYIGHDLHVYQRDAPRAGPTCHKMKFLRRVSDQ